MSNEPTFGPNATIVFHMPAPASDKAPLAVDDVTVSLYSTHFALRALGAVLNADPILVAHSEQVLSEASEAFAEHDTVVHELGRRAASRFLNFAIGSAARLAVEHDLPEEITDTAMTLLVSNLEVANDHINRRNYTFRNRQAAATAVKSALNTLGVIISQLVPIAREQRAFADFETRHDSALGVLGGEGFIGTPNLDATIRKALDHVLGGR